MVHVRPARLVLVAVLFLAGMIPQARVEAQDGGGQSAARITAFSGSQNQGHITFVGVTANCPAGTVIRLSGPDWVDGATGVVDNNGNFSITVVLPPGEGGDVTAIGTTPGGQTTTPATYYVVP